MTATRDDLEPVDDAPPPAAEGLARAARSRTVIAGPNGHPFHPILAGVAIAAWSFSVAFDLLSFAADQAWVYARGAYVLTGVGVAIGVAAATLGLIDLLGVPRGTRAFQHGVRHLVAMDVALGCFAISFALRRRSDFAVHDAVDILPFLLSLVGVAALATGVWLGHRLAYGYGVRVTTADRRREAFVEPS